MSELDDKLKYIGKLSIPTLKDVPYPECKEVCAAVVYAGEGVCDNHACKTKREAWNTRKGREGMITPELLRDVFAINREATRLERERCLRAVEEEPELPDDIKERIAARIKGEPE